MRGRTLRITVVSSAVFALMAASRVLAVTEPPPDPIRLSLYEWMGVAPIVVAADIVVDDERFVRASVKVPIKGVLSDGPMFEVEQRRINRDREEGVPALSLKRGTTYLLLLVPTGRRTKASYPEFDLARGVRGARALPPEGSEALIDAARRLGEVQDRKNDEYLWTALPDMLEDSNPVLVDTALDLYVKFHREGVALAPLLAPLLSHPRPDFRQRSALLLGRVLRREQAAALPERSELVAELTGRARRDDDATVRREAAAALAALPDPGVDETLRAISHDDPDQNVRFEAEKSLAERAPAHSRPRSD